MLTVAFGLPPGASERGARVLGVPLLGLLALGALASPFAAAASTFPDGFLDEEILAALESPATLVFSPDGRLFVGERINGRLLVAKRSVDGETWSIEPTPFYTFDIPKDAEGNPERHNSSGLRDIAFDPDFASNGFVYAFYMRNNPRHNRVVRIQASALDPDVADPASETLLLDLPFNATGSSGSHNGAAVELGADGMLYVTTGDGWSGGDPVQTLATWTGKVLRIAPDGTIPPDNPFFTQATGDYRAIFGLGLRNPFSLSYDAMSGNLFINDAIGPAKADVFLVEPAANYGHQGTAGGGVPRGAWTNVGAAGSLVTGGAWYPPGGSFPAEFDGSYFVALWGGNGNDDDGAIGRVLSFGRPTTVGFATQVHSGNRKPVLTRVDPLTGDLFYLLTTYETGAGSVNRVRWTGQSSAATPQVSPPGGVFDDPVTVSMSSASPGATIRYTLDGSTPDGKSALYVGPILIEQTSLLRARAFAPPLLPSSVAEAFFQIGPSSNLPPVAEAGPDQLAAVGDLVVLNGSASFDPDGDDEEMTESWIQLSGPPLDFEGDDLVVFLMPQQTGTYVFELTVFDAEDSDSDTTALTVLPCLNDVRDGLVGRWSFEEGRGEVVLDSSTGALNGIVAGATWTSETPDGSASALDFDGIDDQVAMGDFDLGGSALTITLWMRADDFGQMDGRLVSKASGVQDEEHLWMVSTIEQGGEHRLRFRLKTGGATTTLIAAGGALEPGEWTHVAAVYDGAQMRLYKDALLVGSTAKSGAVDTDPLVPVAFGDQPTGNRPFDGILDEVRMYGRALTVEELAILATGEGGCEVLFADGFESGDLSAWSNAVP